MSVNANIKEKHLFPKDWLKLSDKQVIEQLQYLLDHYKEYKISKLNDDVIEIAGISFFKFHIGDNNSTLDCYYINHQKLYSMATEEVFNLCEKLFNIGQQATKNKIDKRKFMNVSGMVGIIVASLIFGFVCGKKACNKDTKIEKHVEKYDNYNKYKQIQSQIINYCDVKTK